MTIYTASQAQMILCQLVNDVQLSGPTHIVGKHNKAVIMAEDEYDNIMETLYLQSIPGMMEALKEAAEQPLHTCHKKLDW